MSDPPQRPASGKTNASWYRRVGRFIASEAGASMKPDHDKLVFLDFTNRHGESDFFFASDPTSRSELYEFARLCGHVALSHLGEELSEPHRQNRAEHWAIAALKRCGLDAPPRGEMPLRPSTQVVQEGRQAAARRYRKVATDLAFEAGVKEVEYDRRSLSGFAHVAISKIQVPEPTTRRRLFIFAHECGHVALVHNGRLPRYREEYEAEQWAIAALRRHGVAVPRKELKGAKSNVARRIRQEVRRGAKPAHIDREAVRFAGLRARQLRLERSSSPES